MGVSVSWEHDQDTPFCKLALWQLPLLMLMLTLPTLPMAMATPMPLLFPSAPALVLTPSPKELLFLMLDMLVTMATTLARGLLMLMPTMLLIPMLLMDMLPLFLLAPALVLTPSPRVLMLPLKDMSLTMVMLATTLARGLLMLMLTMLLMDMLLLFPSVPAPVLTPSLRVLMPLPRDMALTTAMLDSMAMASKLEKI